MIIITARPSDPIPPTNATTITRKRRPAGTLDSKAEVVSLSPRTLMESERHVCEICQQGFRREQNLQMHRRRHSLPWRLVKRAGHGKRVYVCPEETCLHHSAAHALGDLVGIKKHFRRKHGGVRQWACHRCAKSYAVHSDFKAHVKTCGTRGHSCHCGRVFSRVESFTEHQDSCHMARSPAPIFLSTDNNKNSNNNLKETCYTHGLTMQLLTVPPLQETATSNGQTYSSTHLQLSTGSSCDFSINKNKDQPITSIKNPLRASQARTPRDEELRQAWYEKAYADEARREARIEMEKAERELADAKRARQHARAELDKAHALKDYATSCIRQTMLKITCHACKPHLKGCQGMHAYSSPTIGSILGCQVDNRPINQTQNVG